MATVCTNRLPAALLVLADAFRNGDLRRLQLASVTWASGEAAYLVGLLVVAYQAGGTTSVALLAVIRALPSVVLAPLLAAAANRLPPATQLRLVLGVRVATMTLATVFLVAGGDPTLVFVLAGIDAVAAAVLRPIRGALVPALARSPEELVATNVATSTGESLAALLGPAIAAVLLIVSGPVVCVVAGTAGLMIATASALRLDAGPVGHVVAHTHRRSTRLRVPDSLSQLARLEHARVIVALFVCQRFVRGMLTVLVVSTAIELLGMGDAGVGLLGSAVGLGGLVGGFLALGLVSRARLAPWFAAGVALWGAGILLPGLVPVPFAAVLLLATAGVGKVVLDVSGFSLLQRTVPAEVRGPVLGLLEGLVTAALALGALAASWLVAVVGPGGALLVAGGLPIAAAAMAWFPLRGADVAAVMPDRELRLLRLVPLFRPLRLNSLELLARGMEWTRVPPGREVVRQAELGDRFYVVESGRLEVLVDGLAVRRLEPGASFGEIALLHARPRTATVRAVDDAVLAAIDGEAFLAAISGHHESAAAAEAQAAERLAAAGG